MKKREIIIIGLLSTTALIIIFTVILILSINQNRISFYIDGKKMTTLSKVMDYQDDIDYSVQAIKLTAKKNDKDVSKQIKVNKIKITKLKTYKIIYSLDNEEFIYEMKVVDKTAPIITGESTITLQQDDPFDQGILKLSAIDNFDKDITAKLTSEGSVDTSIPNDYELIFKVSDSSNNTSEFKSIIHVEKKEERLVNSNNHSITQNNSINVVGNPNDISVLINKSNQLSDGWVPSDLVSIGGGHVLRAEAANTLQQMRQAAQNSGIAFNVVSSYRSQAYQTSLYNNYFASDPINAPFYSAYPRTSEHELGLAIDISYVQALHSDLQNTSLGQWMAEHAHEYGWIMRYPYGKSDITGYVFEAWHYRYVGTSLATAIRNSALTLEEYY